MHESDKRIAKIGGTPYEPIVRLEIENQKVNS